MSSRARASELKQKKKQRMKTKTNTKKKKKENNVKVYLSSLEPIGTKAPALTGDLKGGWKDKRANSSIVLTCPAQGYPVPSFR